MAARHPGFRDATQEIFDRAGFIRDLGMHLVDCGPGWCDSALALAPRHLQQHGYVHAGVEATMADHTAGAAGTTLIDPGECVLTIEFKVNFLHPGQGDRLVCRGRVLRPGRRLIVAESEVCACRDAREVLVAKATVTLAVRNDPTRKGRPG